MTYIRIFYYYYYFQRVFFYWRFGRAAFLTVTSLCPARGNAFGWAREYSGNRAALGERRRTTQTRTNYCSAGVRCNKNIKRTRRGWTDQWEWERVDRICYYYYCYKTGTSWKKNNKTGTGWTRWKERHHQSSIFRITPVRPTNNSARNQHRIVCVRVFLIGNTAAATDIPNIAVDEK